MVKTLRVTGVAAVLFAGLVLASVLGPVSLIHVNDKNDQRMKTVLDAPGAVDRFHELHGDGNTGGKNTTPPLVVQAGLLKDILDPKVVAPPATKDASTVAAGTTPRIKPPVVSAKFTLLGTSYSPSNPNASFAYIREDGAACKWVQCGQEIGYLTIKEVRENSVVCWDGSKESEIPMEVAPERVTISGDEVTISGAAAVVGQPVEVKTAAGSSRVTPKRPATPSHQPPMAPPKVNAEEQQALSDLATELRKSQNIPDGAGSVREAEQAAVDKAIAEFKASRVGPQETQKLENLDDEVSDGNDRPRIDLARERMKRLNSARAAKD
ncbi:MAG: hypothetical protein ACM3VT_15025 [Solirubrobacterales bacterium]